MVKVITYGTFDLFHEGHYRLLERARALGDWLIVGVTTESYDRARGKLNVVDPLMTRIENVKRTGFADEIIIEEALGQKFSDIKKYGVDIFAIGSDWTGQFDYLGEYCKVVYLERTKNISSTMLRERERRIQRIGIIGTGRIAGRFLKETMSVSGIEPQAVYNPHPGSAARFADQWDLNPYEDLGAFFRDIDVAYVASPHETHYGYAKSALLEGKHVICEKPMALRAAEARELFALARERGLVLMEGIKTAYCPGFQKLLGIACSGRLGAIRNVEACFTKLEGPNTRELTDRAYGGSFLELGSYVLLPIVKLLGEQCESIRFESIRGENGLDLFTRASFCYPNGLATATCGLGVKSEGRLLVAGTKGYIVAEPPWWKTSYFEVHYEDANRVEKYTEAFLEFGLRYEVSDLLNRIGGEPNGFKLSEGESVAIAGIMEQFRKEAAGANGTD